MHAVQLVVQLAHQLMVTFVAHTDRITEASVQQRKPLTGAHAAVDSPALPAVVLGGGGGGGGGGRVSVETCRGAVPATGSPSCVWW